MNAITPRRALLVALASVSLAGGAVLVPLQGQAAQNLKLSCTVTIDQTGSQVATYTNTFPVSTRTGYSDDASTPTRMQTFDAVVDGKTVRTSYFKDVSVFDYVGLDVDVPLVNGRGSASGRAESGDSTSRYLLSYVITCAKV